MRRSLRLPFLLSLPLALLPLRPATAKPPTVEGYVRIDEFNQLLAGKLQELREAEEFEKKPFPEQLVIKWEKGATSFKKVRKINGPDVVEEVFEWEELQSEPPTDATKRLMELLPKVLRDKYGAALKMDGDFKRERYKLGKILVDNLVKPPLHVRKLAIDCLEAMHHTRRNYVPEDPKDKRLKGQKAWKNYIERVRK